MKGLVLGDLTIDVDDAPADRISLKWKGASNSRDPDSGLRPFLGLVLAQASSRAVPLELHFEALAHFNSSTISAVLRFIEEARTRKVKVGLFYDRSLRWQAHNFEAMKALMRSDGLLEIHPLGLAPQKEEVGPN